MSNSIQEHKKKKAPNRARRLNTDKRSSSSASMSSAASHRLARGGAAAVVVIGLGCASAGPRAPDADVKLTFDGSEARPAVIARDVDGLMLDGLGAQKGSGPSLDLDGVKSLVIKSSAPLMDTTMSSVGKMTL
jgi:hypothetical protein